MKVKFKDTKIGNFLATKGVAAADLIADIMPSAGYLGIVKNIIHKATDLTKEDKEEAEKILNSELELFKEELADTKNARDMHIEALHQDDKFTKRFVAYLTIALTGTASLMVIGLYFMEVPDKNKELIYMAIGIFFGGFTSAINFWMGTTFNSRQRSDVLYKQLSK